MSIEIADETKELVEVCGCGSWEHSSDLSVIRHDIWELKTQVNALLEIVGMIKDQVEPAMEAVANSPLGKMLGVSNG